MGMKPALWTIRVFALVALLLPQWASAKVYRCTNDDGKIEYSDQPCGEEVEIKDDTHFGGTSARRPVPTARDKAVDPAGSSEAEPANTTGIPEGWIKRNQNAGERQRIGQDYDRRLLILDKRIVELNSQIVRAVDQGRSEEAVATLVEQEQEVRQQREALAREKAQRLAQLDAADD
jgi:hypothetical protein